MATQFKIISPYEPDFSPRTVTADDEVEALKLTELDKEYVWWSVTYHSQHNAEISVARKETKLKN